MQTDKFCSTSSTAFEGMKRNWQLLPQDSSYGVFLWELRPFKTIDTALYYTFWNLLIWKNIKSLFCIDLSKIAYILTRFSLFCLDLWFQIDSHYFWSKVCVLNTVLWNPFYPREGKWFNLSELIYYVTRLWSFLMREDPTPI